MNRFVKALCLTALVVVITLFVALLAGILQCLWDEQKYLLVVAIGLAFMYILAYLLV